MASTPDPHAMCKGKDACKYSHPGAPNIPSGEASMSMVDRAFDCFPLTLFSQLNTAISSALQPLDSARSLFLMPMMRTKWLQSRKRPTKMTTIAAAVMTRIRTPTLIPISIGSLQQKGCSEKSRVAGQGRSTQPSRTRSTLTEPLLPILLHLRRQGWMARQNHVPLCPPGRPW